MTPDDDRRWRDGVTSAIAALQAGERYNVELFETLRREIRESELRQADKIVGVGHECEQFRLEVRERWIEERKERKEREAQRDARALSIWQKAAIAFTIAGVLSSPVMLILGVGPG